jgi:hypothetical protein
MRLAVIRADLPAPFLLADLEQVSRRNDPVDAPGQERYIALPTAAEVTTALANASTGVGATVTASAAPTSLTIAAGNKVLRLKTSSAASFVAYTIAEAVYASTDALIVAINTALTGSGIHGFKAGVAIVLESTTHGVSSYLQLDTVANGSTANTNLNFADGVTRTMPAASAFLTAAGIPGGPVNVSQTALQAVGASTNTLALKPFYDASDSRATVVANAIAPIVAETPLVLESFLVGNLAKFRSASYDPDSRRTAVPAGAAVGVVADDGSTAFSTAHTLPVITTGDLGTPSAGIVTITGTGLGNENGGGTLGNGVVVKFTGTAAVRLEQKAIIHAGGSVLPTAIVIPASLIPGVALTTTFVQVQVRQRLSNKVALV